MKGFAMYRRTLSVLATAVLLAGVMSAVPAVGSTPSWQRYVVAPASRDVRPERGALDGR